jgi:hypothetical protein
MQARLERMKARLFRESYCKKEWRGDDLSIFDADPSLAAKPLVIRRALAVRKACREMPIAIKPEELIVYVSNRRGR